MQFIQAKDSRGKSTQIRVGSKSGGVVTASVVPCLALALKSNVAPVKVGFGL